MMMHLIQADLPTAFSTKSTECDPFGHSAPTFRGSATAGIAWRDNALNFEDTDYRECGAVYEQLNRIAPLTINQGIILFRTHAVAGSYKRATVTKGMGSTHVASKQTVPEGLVQDAKRLRKQKEHHNIYLARLDSNRKREQLLLSYLDELDGASTSDPDLDLSVLGRVRETWEELRAVCGDAIRVPFVGPAPDGSFLFTWRAGSDYLELQFEVDSSRTLFYQDHSVPRDDPEWEAKAQWYDEAEAGESLPSKAWTYLRRFVIIR